MSGSINFNTDLISAATQREERRSGRKMAMLKRSGLFRQNVKGVDIFRASSLADLRAAYQLVHDVYRKSGYIHPEPSGMRLRIFESNSEMATFVAKADSRVVGVMSVIGDSAELGLPSDAAFKVELDCLRSTGARLCEATNQVVAEEFRKSSLATEMIRCAVAQFIAGGYDEAIAAVCPSHSGFCQILGFREIGSERSYSFKLSDPVVALGMDVNKLRAVPTERNEVSQFIRNFLVEENPFSKDLEKWSANAERHFLSERLLRQLFVTETSFITECSGDDLRVLKEHWGSDLFAAVTGHSTWVVTRKWGMALLSALRLIDDEPWLALPSKRS